MVDREKIDGWHVYWDVDDETIYEGVQTELGDFEAFVQVTAFLS